jgi:phospholipid-binding lipoprotein MlaA
VKKANVLKRTLLIILIFGITGCATNRGPVNPQDPYEHFNRQVFAFNMAIDRALFRPIARVYEVVLPWQLRKGVTNAFNNIGDVTSAANEVLQLDFPQAIADLARVVINTIIGIGGLFDVATSLGLERDVEDFGLTLAHWGSRDTPYLVLPFIGVTTIRDAVGLPVNYFLLSPWAYVQSSTISYSMAGLYVVQRRALFLIGDKVVEQAFDPYVFVRDAYLQRREYLINERDGRRVFHFVDENGVKRRRTQTLKESNIVR